MSRINLAGIATVLIISAFFLCPTRAMPQGVYGTIGGLIADPSGAAVPGVSVKVINTQTGVTQNLTTNGSGLYNAVSLLPGTYKIEADAVGFKSSVVNGIVLEVNANAKVDLTLQIGQATEIVTVAAESPLLQTQQSSLGQTLNRREVDQLPTGRNVYALIGLSGGVSQQAGCDGCGTNGNVRINGDRPRNQDYILDGSTTTQPVFGGQAFTPAIDTIQEFKIETNSLSAEYGKAGGGIITAVTKSGTNQFHGSAYFYGLNKNLNARNYFDDVTLSKNPFDSGEYGGTIGGPIVKGKLFFFTDFQRVHLHGSSIVTGSIVPDADFRNGNLSALCTAGFDGSGNCADSTQQIHYPGTSTVVPFNTIPSDQISPIAQSFLAIWPSSSVAGGSAGANGFAYNTPSSSSINRINPRIDFNATASDHFFGVFHRQWGTAVNYDLIIGPAGQQTSKTNDYSLTAAWTHVFSSTMLNDVRFGYMHRIGDRTTYGQGFTSPADFGIQGIPDCLASVPGTNGGTKCGTPGVSISGFTGLSSGQTLYEPTTTIQINDVMTSQLGRHSLKIGGEARHYSIDNYQPNGVTGGFSFSGSQTGNAFADFLFGAVNNGSVQVQNAMLQSRAWSYSLFIQDDFKLTRTLTLNLGLRWQFDQSFHEAHNGLAFFNPFSVQWEQFGVNAPHTPFDTSRKEFGPRVGFAWNPKNNFVVRGGYGIMFPGAMGHGRGGDGQPGPNLLANTPIPLGTNWSSLPAITSPDPASITAPIPVNSNVSFSFWAPRNQTPAYMQLWNFTVEQQFGNSTVAQLAYVGSHGTHLPINYAYNICQQTPESTAQFGFDATTSPYCPQAAQTVLDAGGSLFDLVVNPGMWNISSSVYHSMQAKVERRFSRGFSLIANLTWSKLIDDSSSDWGGFWSLDALGQNFYDRKSERSVSAGNVPFRFALAPIVELPFGPGRKWLQHGIASQVAGGWRATAIYSFSTGSPFGITDNSYGFCNAAHVLSDRPMMIGNPLPSGFKQTPNHWFDTNAFDFSGNCPAAGLLTPTGPFDTNKAFGDAPRYFSNIHNPGVNDLDLSVQKDFNIPAGERTRITFRADFFNLPNHPQFGNPIGDPLNANFGKVTRTATNIGNRTIQLGLHLYF